MTLFSKRKSIFFTSSGLLKLHFGFASSVLVLLPFAHFSFFIGRFLLSFSSWVLGFFCYCLISLLLA